MRWLVRYLAESLRACSTTRKMESPLRERLRVLTMIETGCPCR
jgi:hypothetical protein